jgi:hypothetical protein
MVGFRTTKGLVLRSLADSFPIKLGYVLLIPVGRTASCALTIILYSAAFLMHIDNGLPPIGYNDFPLR